MNITQEAEQMKKKAPSQPEDLKKRTSSDKKVKSRMMEIGTKKLEEEMKKYRNSDDEHGSDEE